MGRSEALHTRLGEMLEMIDCHAISSGSAKAKNKPGVMPFEKVMKLR